MTQLLTYIDRYLPYKEAKLFWLKQSFRLLAVGLAGLHAWAAASNHSMNPDGISYLDIGDAYFRGDWEMAINTVWSPLYSWILGAVMWLFKPSMRWEFPMVHLVNYFIFMLAIYAFEFMWNQIVLNRRTSHLLSEKQVAFPEWAWWSIGYLLFIWVTLILIRIWAVTPDLLMTVFVFLAAGMISRIRAGQDSWHNFALLGCILGLGYLSKAIMLPISVFFLLAGFWAVGDIRRAVYQSLISFFCILLISGPFILIMSIWNGQLTFGDAGKFTYVRHVNQVVYPHWQGDPPGDGTPVHPSRQIFKDPPIYEFGSPIGGTYPISFDQTYWYEGIIVRFDLMNQIRQFISSFQFYADLFIYQQAAILFSLALVYVYRWGDRFPPKNELQNFSLSLIGLLVMLLYAPILVAGRYVGAFVIIFWSDLFANARLPEFTKGRRLIIILSFIIILFQLSNITLFNVQKFFNFIGGGDQQPVQAEVIVTPSWPGAVAEELWQLGIEPGDPVAVIGYAFESSIYWARLARVILVAEMLEWQADPFWFGDEDFQQQVLLAFKSAGARAVIAENVPRHAQLSGWHQVEDSNYYIIILAKDL
jgi:hypothetical protein